MTAHSGNAGDERYRATIGNSADGVWRLEFDPPIDITLPTDAQTRLLYVNGRLADCNDVMAGMTAVNDLGTLRGGGLNLLLPRSDPALQAELAAFIESGYRGEIVLPERRVDGRTRYYVDSLVGVVDAGHLLRIWGTQRDLTDQKIAEKALHESHERFRELADTAQREARDRAYLAAIVESSDDAIISKDLNGVVRSCNEAAERLFGYTAAEMVGQPIRMIIPADRQAEEDDIISRIRRGERVDHFQTVRRAKDGTLVDVSLTISPVRDASGVVIGASKIARDITEQKRHAAALAAEEAWFQVTLGSIGDAVIAANPDGSVRYMNAAAETLTGWSASAAVGRPLDDVFRLVQHETQDEALLIAADGSTRPIERTRTPIRDGEGRMIGIVQVFRDVGERRRIESERQTAIVERERLLEAERAARSEAERASRVKDDFVAMVSHELRTPLNAILGWTQLMSRGRTDPTVVERGLDIIARNTRLQAQLISDLLDISRIVAGKIQLDTGIVDLRAIVADAIETIEQDAQTKGVVIVEELDERPSFVTGDPSRLQQIVWNLLSNAIKFTPRDGHVRVSLRFAGETAEIQVADDGAGIRPDFVPNVFDRFHQADRSITRRFGGLGLGLSIVKHLVDLHGGTVRAESPGEGQGSTFTVTLPATDASDVDAIPIHTMPFVDVNDGPLEGVRVLVVEDEVDTLDFLTRLLESQGAAVMPARSARQALEVVRESPVDLLISDIGLPEVDGYDLIQQLRREPFPTHATPAIALTAYARSEDRTRALRAGYQAHVAKPVEPTELIAMVTSFVELTGAQCRPH